jgi:hypothetical protein
MQVAGTRCDVCGKNIAWIKDGVYCPGCSRTYHVRCLAGDRRCSVCGIPCEAQSLPIRAEARLTKADLARRKGIRQMLVLGLALVLVGGLFVVIGSAVMSDSESVATQFLLARIAAVCIVAGLVLCFRAAFRR